MVLPEIEEDYFRDGSYLHYISLQNLDHLICYETTEPFPGVFLDWDDEGSLLSIEILGGSNVEGIKTLSE